MNNEEKILNVLETLVTKVDGMEKDIKGLKQDVGGLKQDVSVLKQDVRETKERVITIENVHGKQLSAALDGYTQVYEISNKIREDIASIKDETFTHDVAIRALRG